MNPGNFLFPIFLLLRLSPWVSAESRGLELEEHVTKPNFPSSLKARQSRHLIERIFQSKGNTVRDGNRAKLTEHTKDIRASAGVSGGYFISLGETQLKETPSASRDKISLANQDALHSRPGREISPTTEPEPSGKVEPEPSAETETWPEPGPDWMKAYKTWGRAWHFHVYFFATVFFAMAIYAAYLVVHHARGGLQKEYLSITLNVVMCIFGSTRAFVLYFDPYHQGDLIDAWKAMLVLWSVGGPCLTSSDSLVILALLETARISLAPPKLQKFKVIISIIISHFVLVLLTDFVVSDIVEAKAMLVFCQTFFICWGSILGLGYFALAYKLDQKLFAHTTKDKSSTLYIRLIYASGISNFFLTGLFVYSSAGVFGVYSSVSYVEAWPWWALQTCLRTSEMVSCILVFTVSAKRKNAQKSLELADQWEETNMETGREKHSRSIRVEVEADGGESEVGIQGIDKASFEMKKQGKSGKIEPMAAPEAKYGVSNASTDHVGSPAADRHITLNDEDSEYHTMFSDLQKAKVEAFHLQEKTT